MNLDRYETLFTALQSKKEKAFIPFVSLGDPTPELSLEILRTLIESGADALEIGIPFSDPLADGPTIQNATLRAFAGGISVERCFEILTQIRKEYPTIPIGLLIYANLVFKNGIDHFYARCKEADIDSVLIPDVPLSESKPFRDAALAHNIAPIYICPPNATDETINKIAELGKGYTYLVSRAGVTGMDNKAHLPHSTLIEKLNRVKAPAVIQGFGLSTPEQIKEAISSDIAGAISGSAVVNIIEQYHNNPKTMLVKLSDFIRKMKAATHL